MKKLELELSLTHKIIGFVDTEMLSYSRAEEIRLQISKKVNLISSHLLHKLNVLGYDVKRVADVNNNLKPRYYFSITRKKQ